MEKMVKFHTLSCGGVIYATSNMLPWLGVQHAWQTTRDASLAVLAKSSSYRVWEVRCRPPVRAAAVASNFA